MKRILVVDDEQHVVDHILRIVEREVPGEFLVAGTASSGRETLEKVPQVQPDIIVLDVRMPGLSGLDTIRELQRRGSTAAFVLSTAYERFDIAREALELGVTGYLLKPVGRDSLVQGLRNASLQLDRRMDAKRQEVDARERAKQIQGLAADAFLEGLMLGRKIDQGVQVQRTWLGIDKPWGLVGVAAFVSHPENGHRGLETVLQYKSSALCGPLVGNRCLVFMALNAAAEAPEAQRTLTDALRCDWGEDYPAGDLKMAFADPLPFEELNLGWPQALGRLLGRGPASEGTPRFASGGAFEEEEEFHAALLQGDPARVRMSFEKLLSPFEDAGVVSVADRYRIISFLGSALGRMVGLELLDEAVVHQGMDFDDLRQASGGAEFCLLARSRLPAITGALNQAQRWSPSLSGAMEYVRVHYGQPLTLDSVAEHVGLTPKRLSRYFIEELGQGFSDYLIDFRIAKAKVLLSLPGASIKQVSQECGYPDPNYFARLFKKVTGTTPSEFSAIL